MHEESFSGGIPARPDAYPYRNHQQKNYNRPGRSTAAAGVGAVARKGGLRAVIVAKEFHWLPNGPIQQLFQKEVRPEFLASSFFGPGEKLVFRTGMLSRPAPLICRQ